ncbi:hypothetical protein [Kitasatospora sp. NPDC088346]|uniref:hypothetical protein n=1 Tax=Kitasatospora sp. NPDC088346 TaxID=3364073 RepID=UPI00382D4D59
MPVVRERAMDLAARLAEAAGARVFLVGSRSGYLLTTPVPRDPARIEVVLPALRLADRFGHSTRNGGVLWCEVGPRGRPVRDPEAEPWGDPEAEYTPAVATEG